jgi:GT2 family glycosyltransferase
MIKEANAWGADAFFMINPDTLIEPTTIALLSAALTAESCLGSVAPKIRRWDFATLAKTDQIDTCGLTVGSELNFSDIGQGATDQGQFDQTKILGPSGAAGLYRLTALNKIKDPNGYLDERMFMYKEDCDLAYRLYLAGFASRLVPEALVYHDRTASAAGSGILGSLKSRAGKSRSVRSWSFLNQHLLFIKFWAQQKPASKVRILLKVIILWLFALIREPFLLKNYVKIREYLTAAKKTGSTID